jgi:dCTP deaminase
MVHINNIYRSSFGHFGLRTGFFRSTICASAGWPRQIAARTSNSVVHRHRRLRGSGYARRVLLSDRDLRAEIAAGRLGIDPFDDALVQPSSVDVRLDTLFRVFNNTRYTHIDPAQQQDELTSLVEPAEGEPFVLHPGEFVLGSTLETCTLPEDLAGRLEGKSSLGRLGLLTHSTAGFIDPGFSGHITLELSNVANLPITLWPGMKIGQLCILRLTSPAENPYGSASVGSKYQGQRGPTPSRSYLNFIRST